MAIFDFLIKIHTSIRYKQDELVSYVAGVLRRNGVDEETITEFTDEAYDGDLQATWYTIHKYVNVIKD